MKILAYSPFKCLSEKSSRKQLYMTLQLYEDLLIYQLPDLYILFLITW